MEITTKTDRHWQETTAFEAWKYHAGVGGADKDRMVLISTWLLGISAAIIGFMASKAVKDNTIVEPVAAAFLAIAGAAISLASSFIALMYGGYSNWNWAKADQIAGDYGWHRLYPDDSPFVKKVDPAEATSPQKENSANSNKSSRLAAWAHSLVAWAQDMAEPKQTDNELAPIFWWFFGLSLGSLVMHLVILICCILTLFI